MRIFCEECPSVGELVIAESIVRQSKEMKDSRSASLMRSLTQLGKITRELQEMGTSLRMVPIRATFQKMARLVRGLAKKAGKQVQALVGGMFHRRGSVFAGHHLTRGLRSRASRREDFGN